MIADRSLIAIGAAIFVTCAGATEQMALAPNLVVRLRGDGSAFEYAVDLREFKAIPLAQCDSQQACSFLSEPKNDPDLVTKMADDKTVRRQIKVPYFAKVALNSGRSLAVVAESPVGENRNTFDIVEFSTGTRVGSGTSQRRIQDTQWVGSNGCFVLLTSSSSLSLMPWHWLAALSGHPAQYDTYYLELRTVDGTLVAETLVHANLKYSAGWLIKRMAAEGLLYDPC